MFVSYGMRPVANEFGCTPPWVKRMLCDPNGWPSIDFDILSNVNKKSIVMN